MNTDTLAVAPAAPAIITRPALPALGALLPEQGGYFHGIYMLGGQIWGEVTAPKADGLLIDVAWTPEYVDVPGATSGFDGLANTIAMAEAGSAIAQAALAARIHDFSDWYIPARGGLLLQYEMSHLLPEDEAFEKRWHWSSTQFSRGNAFNQYFTNGYTYYVDKSWDGGAARFVRRFLLSA